MVILLVRRLKDNQKRLTPANGISLNFIHASKVLPDSNNSVTILISTPSSKIQMIRVRYRLMPAILSDSLPRTVLPLVSIWIFQQVKMLLFTWRQLTPGSRNYTLRMIIIHCLLKKLTDYWISPPDITSRLKIFVTKLVLSAVIFSIRSILLTQVTVDAK